MRALFRGGINFSFSQQSRQDHKTIAHICLLGRGKTGQKGGHFGSRNRCATGAQHVRNIGVGEQTEKISKLPKGASQGESASPPGVKREKKGH